MMDEQILLANEKELKRQRSLANLRPIKPGQRLNPTGRNGREASIEKRMRGQLKRIADLDVVRPLVKPRVWNVVLAILGSHRPVRYVEVVAAVQIANAILRPDSGGVEVVNRIDGKAKQKVEQDTRHEVVVRLPEGFGRLALPHESGSGRVLVEGVGGLLEGSVFDGEGDGGDDDVEEEE